MNDRPRAERRFIVQESWTLPAPTRTAAGWMR